MNDNVWLNALNIVFGLSRIKKLFQVFKTAERAWRAGDGKILQLKFDDDSIKEALKKRLVVDPKQEWEKLQKLNIQTISFFEKSYPKLLKEIGSAPMLLYLKGNAELLREKSLGVVGTRTPSNYGKICVDAIVEKLALSGLVIVSGLAQGIDALVHAATLNVNGKTIAVIGSGLNQIYPRMNLPLAENILKNNGLIVSEYPLDTPALKQNFPARNRIIGGLSLGTLVIESKEDGGALITAKQALENNREVFAVPGPINQPTSVGTNQLIRAGAKTVLCAEDVLQELNINIGETGKTVIDLDSLNPNEKSIVELIQQEPAHIDKITQVTKLKAYVVSSTLTGLELKGVVKNIGGQTYTI